MKWSVFGVGSDFLFRCYPDPGIVDVMGFVIEDGYFLDLANDRAKIDGFVSGFSHRANSHIIMDGYGKLEIVVPVLSSRGRWLAKPDR